LRATRLVGRDDLAVDDGFARAELVGHLTREPREPVEGVPVARDEAITALLDVAEAPEAVGLHVEEPVRMVEGVLAPGRTDWLHPGKRHCGHMAPTFGLHQRRRGWPPSLRIVSNLSAAEEWIVNETEAE
jgi:hypothetical protein